MSKPAFGRRTVSDPARLAAPAIVRTQTSAPTSEAVAPATQTSVAAENEAASLEQELLDWKQARKRAFQVPWRQVSLMASLSFGVAAFVLPDSVNDNVQWLLLALMAASFFAGFAKRRKNAQH